VYTYSCGLLAAGIVGGLLHGHRGSVPGWLLGARFFLLLGRLEETEETVLEHVVFRPVMWYIYIERERER
jgi:hypothetical protein